MIRLVSIFAGTLLIGVVIGSLLRPPRTTISNHDKQSTDSPAPNPFYQDSLDAKESVIADLTEENKRLADYVSTLEAEVSVAAEQQVTTDAVFEVTSEPPVSDASPDSETRRRRRSWDPEGEEGRARREDFVNQMRANMLDVWDGEWENASPESQERISAIAKYQQDLMDIRGEIRGAETDEERQVIFEEMNATRNALNQTLKEEQNAKLGALAEKYGVKDEADVAAFIRETQKTIRSPAFQTNASRGGRSGGGFSGGRNTNTQQEER